MYVCADARWNMRTQTQIFVQTFALQHTQTYAYTNACTHARTCTDIHTYIHTGTFKTSDYNCTRCAPGYFSFAGSADCVPCRAGTYSTEPPSGTCTPCYGGSYGLTEAATNKSICEGCPAGTFSTELGASSRAACQDCPSGFFSSQNAATSCSSCLPGSYSSSPGATTCTRCSPGSATGYCSAVSCTPCAAGYYTAAEVCMCFLWQNLFLLHVIVFCEPRALSYVCVLCTAVSYYCCKHAVFHDYLNNSALFPNTHTYKH
jgi:hypothetical protein